MSQEFDHARTGLDAMAFRPFDRRDATVIASWVPTRRDLRLLAPATAFPLTSEKVLAWQRAGSRAHVLVDARHGLPVAYGELNPMRRDPEHWWLGHIIVEPGRRERGLGRTFVRRMMDLAQDACGARRLSLVVVEGNEPAIRCYKALGFRRIGPEQHRYGELQVDLIRYEWRV